MILNNQVAKDIFKKLTKGCVFAKDKNVNKPLKRPLENSVVIKQEKVETEINDNDSITLLSSMNQGNSEPKCKKRKVKDEKKVAALEEEQTNQYRNEYNISVVGRHVPNPAKTFDDLGLKSELIQNLRTCGYSEPTAIQKQGIPIMIAGRQMLACAPTGSGKTLAFLLPIIHALEQPKKDGFRALILCPTRELAKQIQLLAVRLTEGLGFHVHIMSKVNKAIQQYGPKSSGNYDILITTPNRLCYLLKQDPPAINLSKVEWLVADEADKYFEESSTRGFFDQFNVILNACTASNRKIAMFGATYTPAVAKWCVHNMRGLIRLTIGHRNSAVELVDQSVKFVGSEEGKLLEIRNMIRKGFKPPALIFVQSKERAQELHKELVYDNIHVDAIHADRNQDERDTAIRNFREGHTWILICTELMARGIDFKGVNLVVNYDFPQSAISYIHRVGRAGRAGRRGTAVTYFTLEDMEYLRPIAHIIKESGGEVPDYIFSLKKPTKKKKKQMKVSAPKREHITTTPLYENILKNKKKRHILNSKNRKGGKDGSGFTEKNEKKSSSNRSKSRSKEDGKLKINRKKTGDKISTEKIHKKHKEGHNVKNKRPGLSKKNNRVLNAKQSKNVKQVKGSKSKIKNKN